MKKLLLGVVLMLATFAVNAASVQVGNPVFDMSFNSATGQGTQLLSNSNFSAQGFNPVVGSNVGFVFDGELTGISAAVANFVVSVSGLTNWSFSLVNTETQTTQTLLSGIAGSNGLLSAPATVFSGVAYQVVFQGVSDAATFASVVFSPVELSEVPLPAAVWLFGSVLMGGLAMRRRSQKMNAQAVAA